MLFIYLFMLLQVKRLGIINAFIIDIDVYGGLYRGSEPKSTDPAAFLTATVLPFYFSILFVSSWHIIVVLSPFTTRDAKIPLDINFLPRCFPTYRINLVGGLEHFSFFHILGFSSSQLTNSYFLEG